VRRDARFAVRVDVGSVSREGSVVERGRRHGSFGQELARWDGGGKNGWDETAECDKRG
jgi:hypothetical protein